MKNILISLSLLVVCSGCVTKTQHLPSVTVAKLDINIIPAMEVFGEESWELPINNDDLWDIFRKAENRKEFHDITTKNWRRAYAESKVELINKAKLLHLDSTSLSECIDYNYHSLDHLAMVPIAAFSIQYKSENAWVICYVWEIDEEPEEEEHRYSLGHVRAYLFDEKTRKELEMVTCL